ncbi:MAG: hypothetical protein J7L82_00070, partial [Staphylothermus sp.]|nr:hypothetical protein [Staphylothermus sp.]
MRENQNLNQYRQVLFVEYNPYFNRMDIIKRIVHFSKFLVTIRKIYIIFFDNSKHSYCLLHVSKGNYSVSLVNYYEAIRNFIQECESICIMDENGTNVFRNEKLCDCIVSGLHSDIPSTTIDYIEKY